jgi:hypothetical protein
VNSVKEIEEAIAQLDSSGQQQIAKWVMARAQQAPTGHRPRIKHAQITPVSHSQDAFSPLTDEELAEFGLV